MPRPPGRPRKTAPGTAPRAGIIIFKKGVIIDEIMIADDKGRVSIGTKCAGRQFRIIVIETGEV